jgi:hypothetical protein
MASLSQSVSLMMHEFLDSIRFVAVSSVEGSGMDDFHDKVREAAKEFVEDRIEEAEHVDGVAPAPVSSIVLLLLQKMFFFVILVRLNAYPGQNFILYQP